MRRYRGTQEYGCLKCGALLRLQAHSADCADTPRAIHHDTYVKISALTAEQFQKLMEQKLEAPARSDQRGPGKVEVDD